MLEIPTARGLTILADDEYENVLARYSWYAVKSSTGNRFYAHARIPGLGAGAPRVSMHRLIMDPPRGMVVHHINNNGLDNRRANLAIITNADNISDARRYTPGVHLFKQTGKYRAQMRHRGKVISLGMYERREDAIAAVQEARVKHGVLYDPHPDQMR